MIAILLHFFQRGGLLRVERVTEFFRAAFLMKVSAHLANQGLCVIKRIVLRGERLHRNVQALQLLDYIRWSNVSVMNDRGWVQRKDALGAQRAMISNGLDFLYVRRIGGR